MRLMIFIAGLLLATSAMAEEKPKTVVKQLDKSSPLLMSTSSDDTDEGKDAPGTRAQDYNSSRSNTTSRADHASGLATGRRDAASGLSTGKRQHAAAPRPNVVCTDGVDDDCDGVASTSPANHNTTRSNRTLRAAPQSGGASGGTRAQDYNSSRSNTSSVMLDDDSDGDSLGEEVRCSMRSDKCVDAGDDDRVVRKKPGRKR